MKVYQQDVNDIILWVVFVMFLFALAYLAEGGSNLLVLLFVVIFAILAVVGLMQSTNKFLEEYYWNKRETRNSEKFFKDLYRKKLDDKNHEGITEK